jgi:(p)ppGpp synthase/HD superfamily hydrolase
VLLLGKRFTDAFDLAREHHLRQTRKGTEVPYLAHLMGVASIALEHGASEDEAIAALLHDVVEDGGGQEALARIREEFGDEVAGIVWACTDTDEDPKPPWVERKRRYLATIPGKSEPALLVSASDKLHNARAILDEAIASGDEVWKRFNEPHAGPHLWYYRSLADAFAARVRTDAPRIRRLAGELERTVAELERRTRA